MSYDVELQAKIQDVNKWVELGDSFNITFNLADMFHECIGSTPREWDGMNAGELEPELRKAIIDIGLNAEYYKQFEAKNGWGTIDGCLHFMRGLADCCYQYPYATVRTSC